MIDAVAAAELEDEVVARLGDAALVIDQQPDMVDDEALVVQVVPLVDVVLRGTSFPSASRE